MNWKWLLSLAAALAVPTAASALENIPDFAKSALALNLVDFHFGTDNEGDARLARLSADYNHEFPNRHLNYIFKDRHLVSLEVTISAMQEQLSNDGTNAAPRRACPEQKKLDMIRDRFVQLARSYNLPLGVSHYSFVDGSLRAAYEGLCSPQENFFARIRIEPVLIPASESSSLSSCRSPSGCFQDGIGHPRWETVCDAHP